MARSWWGAQTTAVVWPGRGPSSFPPFPLQQRGYDSRRAIQQWPDRHIMPLQHAEGHRIPRLVGREAYSRSPSAHATPYPRNDAIGRDFDPRQQVGFGARPPLTRRTRRQSAPAAPASRKERAPRGGS